MDAGITSDVTKYHTLVGAVESDVLACVSDIILQPPAQNLYATLRQRLEDHYTDSEEKQLRKLLSDLELGDRRPSQLLREMRDLAGGKVSDALLKSLWLQRLPTQIQAILATSTDDLAQLTTMADKMNEIFSMSTPSVGAIAQYEPNPNSSSSSSTSTSHQTRKSESNTLAEILNEIRNLSSRIDSALEGRTPRARSSSRHRGRADPTHFDGVCKFHHQYKEKAFKCISPCSFPAKPSSQPIGQSKAHNDSSENSQGRR
uniref:DUF7041 domain-containing protein n=1 Tax=Lygus hesperus TaxID=30085 RepID=A0A0K8SFH9_LYGHE